MLVFTIMKSDSHNAHAFAFYEANDWNMTPDFVVKMHVDIIEEY